MTKKYFSHPHLCHEVEEKDVVLGLRSPKKRSLLGVNEHFEGEHNDKIHFLFSLNIGKKVFVDVALIKRNGGWDILSVFPIRHLD